MPMLIENFDPDTREWQVWRLQEPGSPRVGIAHWTEAGWMAYFFVCADDGSHSKVLRTISVICPPEVRGMDFRWDSGLISVEVEHWLAPETVPYEFCILSSSTGEPFDLRVTHCDIEYAVTRCSHCGESYANNTFGAHIMEAHGADAFDRWPEGSETGLAAFRESIVSCVEAAHVYPALRRHYEQVLGDCDEQLDAWRLRGLLCQAQYN